MSVSALKLFLNLLSNICHSLPTRSIKTFLELVIGAIVSNTSHVTDAYINGNFRLNWTAYYKWLCKGSWSYEIEIDDTHVYRSSKKAPCIRLDKEYSAKPNRSKYVWVQNWCQSAREIDPPE